MGNNSLLDRYLAALNALARLPSTLQGDTIGNPIEARTRRELVEVAHVVAAKRLSWGSAGCISARSGTRDFLISKADAAFDSLTLQDFVPQGLRSPSAEQGISLNWAMHQAIFLAQPKAQAILQVQPPFATVLACREKLQPVPVPEVLALWSTVSWVKFGAAGDKELADAAAAEPPP